VKLIYSEGCDAIHEIIMLSLRWPRISFHWPIYHSTAPLNLDLARWPRTPKTTGLSPIKNAIQAAVKQPLYRLQISSLPADNTHVRAAMSTEPGSLASQRAVCPSLSLLHIRQLTSSSAMHASIEKSDVIKALLVPIARVVAQVCIKLPSHAPEH